MGVCILKILCVKDLNDLIFIYNKVNYNEMLIYYDPSEEFNLNKKFKDESKFDFIEYSNNIINVDKLNKDDTINKLIVLSFSTDAWNIHGKIYAEMNKALFFNIKDISEVKEILEKYEQFHVVFIGSPQYFNDKNISEIKKIFQIEQYEIFYRFFGIMTGINETQLYELFIKTFIFNKYFKNFNSNATIIRNIDDFSIDNVTDNKIYTKEKSTYENILELSKESINMLMITGHARDDHIYIEDGLLCGRINKDFKNSIKSTCYQGNTCCENEHKCYKEGKNIQASSFSAFNIMINSCQGLRIGEAKFPLDYTLLYGFLSSIACSYISSTTIKNGHEGEGLLYFWLAKCGFTLGEITKYLNNTLVCQKLDAPNYILIGDPNIKPYPNGILDSIYYETNETNYEIELKNLKIKGIKKFRIKNPTLIKLFKENKEIGIDIILNRRIKNNSLFYSYSIDIYCSYIDIFLYTFNEITIESGCIKINPKPCERAISSKVVTVTNEMMNLSNINIVVNKLDNRIDEIKRRLHNINSILGSNRYNASKNQKTFKKIDDLYQYIDITEEIILEELLEKNDTRSYHFSELYRSEFDFVKAIIRNEECPYCRNILIQNILKFRLSDYKRNFIVCPSCGTIADYPEEPDLNIKYIGNNKFKKDEWNKISYKIENSSNNTIKINFGYGWEQGKKSGIIYKKQKCTVILKPYESQEINSELKISHDFRAHNYFLRSFAIAEGKVYHSVRNVFVIP